MDKTKKLILDEGKIAQIIRRIAFQIYENNMGAKKLAIVGIGKQGFELGGSLVAELKTIDAKLSIIHQMVDLDKSHPNGSVKLSADSKALSGISVVLVDDVLNTGRTMAYSLMALLEANPSKIEIAVLVDRGHRQFPVSAAFSGYQLSTTLEEHIAVTLGNHPAVHLF